MRAHSNIAQEICPRRLAIGPPVADMPAGRCSQAASPVASTPAMELGLPLGSAPAAASRPFRPAACAGETSLEDFTKLESPDVFLAYPAFDAGRFDLAFRKLACLKLCHNAGLGVGDDAGGGLRIFAQLRLRETDENDRARVGKLRVMHPPDGAVDVLHPPPGIEAADDHHGKVLAVINPQDLVCIRRTFAQKGLVASNARVARRIRRCRSGKRDAQYGEREKEAAGVCHGRGNHSAGRAFYEICKTRV